MRYQVRTHSTCQIQDFTLFPKALLEPRADFTLNGEQEEGCGPLTPDLHLSPGNLRHGPVQVKTHKDVSTLTGVDLPEVEIVSLLAEELPRYTLRADHVFGYDHDDWLHTPLLPPEAALGLTYEQIDETFKYFCKFALSSFLQSEVKVGQVTVCIPLTVVTAADGGLAFGWL
ncbi:trafficking kinesin-binding protein 1 isoform X1 [Silurus meridionalis]|nr:trafficking kinesin-binding protein 1 isoform X1 [Silurus meridionalis]